METPTTTPRHDDEEPRLSWSAVGRHVFSLDLERIHDVPDVEQRRIGILSTVMGALVVAAGFVVGHAIAAWFGASFGVFYFLAGFGGLMGAMGAYRVGVSFFPILKQESRLGSGLRMGFVLLVFCVLGLGLMWVLAGSMTVAR